jgi:hypothetical protein
MRRSWTIIGWVGRWTFIALVLVLALIGFLHLTRGTAVRHVQGVGVDGVPVAIVEPQFPLAVTMLTGARLGSWPHHPRSGARPPRRMSASRAERGANLLTRLL